MILAASILPALAGPSDLYIIAASDRLVELVSAMSLPCNTLDTPGTYDFGGAYVLPEVHYEVHYEVQLRRQRRLSNNSFEDLNADVLPS